MYLKSWGVDGNDYKIKFKEVNTTACNKSDFNDVEGSNSESNFFKTGVNSQPDLDKYGTQLKCIADKNT